jgi:predicted ATPase
MAKNPNMYPIFLSHASKDNEIALRLHNDLEKGGLDVWVDMVDIKPSDDFSALIHNALASSTQVVLLLSEYSILSDYVRAEWEYALGNKKQLFVVLVQKIDKAQIPPRLWTIQRINLCENYEDGLNILINSISSNSDSRVSIEGIRLSSNRQISSSSPIIVGNEMSMSVLITNDGTKGVNNLTIFDEIPSSVQLLSGEKNTWTGDINAKAQIKLDYRFTVSEAGQLLFPGVRITKDNISFQLIPESYQAIASSNAAISVNVELAQPVSSIDEPIRVFYRLHNSGTLIARNVSFTIDASKGDNCLEIMGAISPGDVIDIPGSSSWTHEIKLIGKRYGRFPIPTLSGQFLLNDSIVPFSSTPTSCFIDIGWTNALVGRSDVLGKLLKAFDQVAGKKGQTVIVSGEAGSGKSHLIDYLIKMKSEDNILSLRGQCESFHDNLPFLPFKQIFERILSLPKFGSDEERIQFAHTQLQDLIPGNFDQISDLIYFLVSTERDNDVDLKTRREHFFFASLKFLKALSEKKPVIIYLEDLQWIDASSIELLQFIVDNIDDDKVLILGEYRSEDILVYKDDSRKHHPLSAFIQKNAPKANFDHIEIGSLSKEGLSEWINVLFANNEISNDFLDLVYAETEGNPLFLREVFKSLIEQKILIQNTQNKWQISQPIQDIGIPSTVEQVIAGRLEHLSDQEREELEHASVIGRDFAYDLLRAISEVDDRKLDEFLESYLDIRLIIELEHANDYFRFLHGKFRDFIYDSIRRFRRRRLHMRLAQAMESLFAGSLKTISPIIAYHYFEGGDNQKALEYLLLAGTENLMLYSNKEAQLNFQKALNIIEKTEGLNVEPGIHLEVLNGLAQATRDLNEFEYSVMWDKRVLEVSQKLGKVDTAILAASHISTAMSILGKHDESQLFASKALELSQKKQDPNLTLKLANDLTDITRRRVRTSVLLDSKREISKGGVSFDELKKRSIQTLELIEFATNHTEIIRAYKNMGTIFTQEFNFQKAISYFESAIRIVEKHNDIKSKYVYLLLGNAYRAVGEEQKALNAYNNYCNWAIDVGAKHAEMKAYQILGMQHYAMENYEQAESYLNKGLNLYKDVGAKEVYAQILVCMGLINEKLGDEISAINHYQNALSSLDIAENDDALNISYRKVGMLMFISGEWVIAKKFFERYLSLVPDAPDRGDILEKYNKLNKFFHQ